MSATGSSMKVFDLDHKEVGEETLPLEVFGAASNRTLIHEAVRHHLAAGRAGTHSTKTRDEVSGSGRKLWGQKKTGRARIGSIRSPLWRSGGIVHGPRPRSHDYHFPRRKRQGAVRAALSEKIREGRVVMVKGLELESHRTRDLALALDRLGVGAGSLIIDEPVSRNLDLAARNLPRVKVLRSSNVNVVDIIKYEHLVLTPSAVRKIAEVFAP
jgi:large subunit ribosomal protein L4